MSLMEEKNPLKAQLDRFRREHRALDGEIAGLGVRGADALTLGRMKKRKLRLRDRIARLEDMIHPDIIA